MYLKTKIFDSSNNIILIYFLFICFLNQIKFLSAHLQEIYFFILGFFFIILLYFFLKNKLNYKLKNIIKFYLPILITISLLIFDFFLNKHLFDLKFIFYFSLITLICFITNRININIYTYGIITISIVMISIGAYGWSTGGETAKFANGAWGDKYIYFGYHYFSSTRNEDAIIFLIAYPLSLVFLFFNKWNWKIFFCNQIILISIVLTFSRGVQIITIINMIVILLFIVNLKKHLIGKFFIYLIFSLIIITSNLFIINKTVKIDLFQVLYTKINSIIHFNALDNKSRINNHLYDPSNENINHLYETSIISLETKINQWTNFKSEIKNKKKNYYESSLLYLIYNFNPIIIILLIYFFLRQLFYKIKYYYNSTELIIYIILLVNFFLLNFIYNALDDIWNYLIGLYLISFIKKPSRNEID